MQEIDYKYDIFISYSRRDAEIADKVCEALQKQGITFFIDKIGISGGAAFPKRIATGILESRIVLFLASDNSYASSWVNDEITFTKTKKPGSLLPYIIDGSTLPMELQLTFANINIRTIDEHPIDTVLVKDLCKMLGREYIDEEALKRSREAVQRRAEELEQARIVAEERARAEEERRKEAEEEIRRKDAELFDIQKQFETLRRGILSKINSNDAEEPKPVVTDDHSSEGGKIPATEQSTSSSERNNHAGGCLWGILAMLSPIITAGLGVYLGIKFDSIWLGIEIFLIPGWMLHWFFAGLESKSFATASVSLIGVAVAAGIHLVPFIGVTYSLLTAVAIFILTIYLFLKVD